MIGYIISYDGITFNDGFGFNKFSIQRSVSPARARILGGSVYDMDGMYTYPAEQIYTADLADRNGEFIAKPLYQRLGQYGWLRVYTRAFTIGINWAKLIAIDVNASASEWVTLANNERNYYTLTFACSPFWYRDFDTITQINGTGFTLSTDGNARSTYWQLNITSAITNPLTIEFARNTSGTSTYGVAVYGTSQYDATGSQLITYAASKALGTTLVIDGRTNRVTLSTGANAYGNITLPNTQPNLGYLSPGDTRIRFNQSVTGTLLSRGAYV